MDRFTQQSASDLARNFARNRFAQEIAESPVEYNGPECQNCKRPTSKLTLVPEFLYMGCDECMEEALTVIAHERNFTGTLKELFAVLDAEASMLAESGCTPEEVAAFEKFTHKPVTRQSSLPEVA